jgi:Ribosomal protein L23
MDKNIIIKPIVTEKSMQGNTGKYTFMVAKGASKKDVKKCI